MLGAYARDVQRDTVGGGDHPVSPGIRIGVLGGTFDPVHVGHLVAATWVRAALGLDRVLLVDSLAAVAGGAAGASSATTYIESAAGVAAGARSGLASVVTGLCFLLALFFAPLAGVVPAQATAPALIVVGYLMSRVVRDIPFGDFEEGFPALLTLAVMPFTYSITNGIGAGFIAYCFIKLVRGKGGSVPVMMYGAALAFVIYFVLPLIQRLLSA